MSGYVRSQRRRFDHPLFRNEKFCRGYAWDWLVAHAAYKDRQIDAGGKIVTLRRGQLCYSIRFLATAWNWDKAAVSRYLARLQTETMIEASAETGQTVITICNYDYYQGGEPDTETPSGTLHETAARQQRDSSETNKKEGKEGKEGKKKEEPVGSLSPDGDGPTAPPPLDEISEAVSAYNAVASDAGWPRVKVLSKQRRGALKARLAEAGGIDGWRIALAKARASPLCNGQNDRGWTANFDFLTQQSSFAKLMEGNYDRRPSPDRTAPGLPFAGRDQFPTGLVGAAMRSRAARGH